MEPAAVPLGRFGWFSLAAPFYLAMFLHPAIDFRAPAALATVTVLLRALLERRGAREALAQLAPLLLAGASVWLLESQLAARWLVAISGVQVYVLAAWGLPRLLAPQVLAGEDLSTVLQIQDRVAPIHIAVACSGLLLGFYPGDTLWLVLACPGLLVLRPAVHSALARAETQRQQHLKRSLARAEHARDEARLETARAQEELTRKVDQVALLEDLARSLAHNPDPFQTLARILEVARQLVPCQTVAFFGQEGDQLLPLRFSGPHSERLASARLLAIREPVVEQAWRTGELAFALPDGRGPERLLQGELAIALPFGQLGVLYVGDASRARYEPEEIERLRTLAAQGTPSLQSARYFMRLEQSLTQHAQANEHLQRWAEGLDRILAGARALTSRLDIDELNGLLRANVQAIVPHDFYWLVPRDRCSAASAEGDARPLLEAASSVLESAQPLLFEDLQGSRFEVPSGQVRSLLAVPLAYPDGIFAVLLVGAAGAGQYSRHHLDLLGVLAYLAGSALQNAHTHQEVIAAYEQLRDSQAQLVQSSKMAAVGQLAAGVAHELNTPLGAIALSVESAAENLQRNKPDRAMVRLERASVGLDKAKTIVNKLLFYSREGRRERQPFDLNKVVDDTLDLLSHHLKLDGVAVTFQRAELPSLLGNQNEVQQVIMNLLLNARDAVKEPEARSRAVEVQTRREPGAVALEVRDGGPGLSPELQARIFEPFFTTKPVGKGTGLGLSVSREIVDRHEGSLAVVSSPGEGARFVIRLPLPDS